VPPDTAAQNLATFIAEAKVLTVFGEDLDWDNWNWPGVGNFLVLGSPVCKRAMQPSGELLLHPAFRDFAKTYVRYSESENPSLSNPKRDLAALRTVERALLLDGPGADPANITLTTLNQAAQIAREHFASQSIRYAIGQRLQLLARVMSRKGLTRNDVRSWTNPIAAPTTCRSSSGPKPTRIAESGFPTSAPLRVLGRVCR